MGLVFKQVTYTQTLYGDMCFVGVGVERSFPRDVGGHVLKGVGRSYDHGSVRLRDPNIQECGVSPAGDAP
jgi:hypothetical protein